MQARQLKTLTRERAQAVRAWRLLLLTLLLMLPVTMAFATPEPVHFSGAYAVQHEAGGHTHGPSDMPWCHHVGDHGEASALVGSNRDVESSAPADNVGAIPSQGPAHKRLSVPAGPFHVAPFDDLRPTVPVYLRTQRLRV